LLAKLLDVPASRSVHARHFGKTKYPFFFRKRIHGIVVVSESGREFAMAAFAQDSLDRSVF